ncbi:glycosyltransferase family 1 protein [Bacillus sp. PS06]|uniref:glycosyltransferase family 1 protein n=1 Tax=Bacillus sp. PS06 TaxID=2764176 RepID=UPI00177F1BA3|nr:glycosyltransferase family 1 protein [Bacillus sp. PS06]MBD8071104.1 glycosyltransferase family 1 protein [Bacillus sp. PS06]
MNKPVRVLHVVVNMNRGGAETLIMNLYRNIDRTRVQFDFLTCKEGVFDSEIKELGGMVHRIPYVSDVGHFGYIKSLNHFFSTHHNYSIVHSHLNQMSGLVVREAKKNGIRYCITHSHNTGGEGSFLAKSYKWYSRLHIAPYSDYTFACSQAAAKWLFGHKSNEAKLLNNGIEPESFMYSPDIRLVKRKELGIDNQLVIGHVGRFTKQKNHKFIVGLFSEFLKKEPNSILLLCGDGVLRKEIEKKVNELNIQDNVKFLGVRSDINYLLQAFDIFIFPSLYEGLGVVLIEAQAAGLPCLISEEIPKEVDMGLNLVKPLDITRRDLWINELEELNKEKYNRNPSQLNSLRERGYDIKVTAGWLQDFYIMNSR